MKRPHNRGLFCSSENSVTRAEQDEPKSAHKLVIHRIWQHEPRLNTSLSKKYRVITLIEKAETKQSSTIKKSTFILKSADRNSDADH